MSEFAAVLNFIVQNYPALIGWVLCSAFAVLLLKSAKDSVDAERAHSAKLLEMERTHHAQTLKVTAENTATMLAWVDKQTDRHQDLEGVIQVVKGLTIMVDERLPRHGRGQ